MFIVTLTYTVPVDEVDRHLDDHRAWIDAHIAAGRLLATGRRVPRTGGVLLAPGPLGREAVEQLVATDPYHRAGVAEYEIVEFVPTTTAAGFEALLEA